jgi:hypothetical protein
MAAAIPRKNIAKLNVIAISLFVAVSISCPNGFLNTLKAYTEPIEACTPTADAAISQRFFMPNLLGVYICARE